MVVCCVAQKNRVRTNGVSILTGTTKSRFSHICSSVMPHPNSYNWHMCAPIWLKFGTCIRGIKMNTSIKFGVNLINIQGVISNFTKSNFCHTYRVNRFKEHAENLIWRYLWAWLCLTNTPKLSESKYQAGFGMIISGPKSPNLHDPYI